jgi:hypothetical protein
MESSIAVFLMWQLACEQLPTIETMRGVSECLRCVLVMLTSRNVPQERKHVTTHFCAPAMAPLSHRTTHCKQKMRNLEHHSVHFITHQSFAFY